jgi:hypothetical protein
MSQVSWQAGIPIHQRDSRIISLSEFVEFWQSFRTRLNQSKNSVEPEWILTELPRLSYFEDSWQAGKSSGPQNFASLSTLQEWTWEHYRGRNLTLFTPSIGGSTVVFIGGVRRCCGERLGAWGPLDRPTSHPTWPSGQVSSLHCLSHIGFSSYWLALTRDENRFWKCANTWPADQGDVAGRPHFGSVEPVLYAISFSRVILSVTMPYFGHNDDMHGFWSIWCFSIILCS